MRTFTVKISIGTDSDKAAGTSGKKEMGYKVGMALIIIAGAAGWLRGLL